MPPGRHKPASAGPVMIRRTSRRRYHLDGMRMRPYFLVLPALVALPACTARPFQTSDGTDRATAMTSESNATTGDTGATSGPGTTSEAPSDTTTTGTVTTDPGTTGPVTTGPDPSTSGTTSPPAGPPSTCGPQCDATWEHFGDLNVDAFAGDLSCLTRVHGDVTTWQDADPAVIASLANLQQVDGTFWLSYPSLTDLSTFACLERVDQLNIGGAPQLVDVSLPRLVHAPSIALGGLGMTKLPTFAAEFEGLSWLSLQNNADLVDLTPAATWGAVTPPLSLNLYGNAQLTSLAGLDALIASNGDAELYLQLIDNAKLASLAGVEPTTSGYFYLADLPALTSLAGLHNLASADITLIDLPLVTDLSGLSGLKTAGQLMIGDCVNNGTGGMDGLTSLAGLDNLTQVSDLALANNDNLESLDGAPKLTQIFNAFNAVNNANLSQKTYDSFLTQLAMPPGQDCYGGWDVCPCFQILPW